MLLKAVGHWLNKYNYSEYTTLAAAAASGVQSLTDSSLNLKLSQDKPN